MYHTLETSGKNHKVAQNLEFGLMSKQQQFKIDKRENTVKIRIYQ